MKKSLTIIFLTVFLYLVGFGIIIPILPILSREFGANAFQTGLLMSVYSLMQFAFAPFWGRLSDKHGRRPIIVFCLLGEAASYFIFAYARNLEFLFLARILAGFFGASISTASAYISDVTPPKERSKGMALIGMAFGLGFVVGPALGGQLAMWGKSISSAPHFDTTFSSLWVAGICFLTFVFAFFFLAETKNKQSEHQAKKSRIKNLVSHLKEQTIGSLLIAFGITSLAMSAMEATLVLYVGELYSWSLKEVNYGFAYIGLIIIFTQGFLVRRLIPKLGERVVLVVGIISFATGMFGIGISHDLNSLAVAITLLAVGNGFINPSVMGSISLLANSETQGLTLGITQSLASLGRITGPIVGGILYDKISIRSPYIVAAALSLLTLIILLKIFSKLPSGGKHEKKSAQNSDPDLNEISDFQFENLIEIKVPFVIINTQNSQQFVNELHPKISSLTNILQIVSVSSEDLRESIPNKLRELSLNENSPIVIVGKDKKLLLKSWKIVASLGYKNAYYLHKELIG